jgi:hypothetical protein
VFASNHGRLCLSCWTDDVEKIAAEFNRRLSGSIFCLKSIPKNPGTAEQESPMWHILWTIIIGFIAGIIAKLLHPGSNEPQGFILTTILGIVGAFAATSTSDKPLAGIRLAKEPG